MAKDRFPRTPYDGKPYYCASCGMGFNEWLACEAPDCELETEAAAQARAAEHQRRSKEKA